MTKPFLPLKNLYDQVWPVAMTHGFATDMTGVSLPLLDFKNDKRAYVYQVTFLLYYAVPDQDDLDAPNQITKPYAKTEFDLQSGQFINIEELRSDSEKKLLVGSGTNEEIYNLTDEERRDLQNYFFSKYDDIAQMCASDHVSPEQAALLSDFLYLFKQLSEPPLWSDYKHYAKGFFSWLSNSTGETI